MVPLSRVHGSTDLAYIAGLLDGEGHVGIKRTRAYAAEQRVTPGYHARIGCRMVTDVGLRLVAGHLGGTLRTEDAHTANGRPLFGWQITDRKAEEALRVLLPYLRVKRDVAAVVLELRALQAESRAHRTKVVGYRDFPNAHGTVRCVPNLALSDEYVARCDALYWRCRELNRVGVPAEE